MVPHKMFHLLLIKLVPNQMKVNVVQITSLYEHQLNLRVESADI